MNNYDYSYIYNAHVASPGDAQGAYKVVLLVTLEYMVYAGITLEYMYIRIET